jgi:uncharacterized protein YdbL (DUF1318 family)
MFSFVLAAMLAAAQPVTAAQLRATAQVGEQSDGYLGIVGDAATPELRRQVNSVNIRRRSAYIQLADRRGVQVVAVAATMACELLATSVLPGQYYRLADGVWRRREGNAPVRRPSHCP